MNDQPKTMPIRTRRVEMDGDYAGFWAEVRINVPLASLEALSNADDIYPTMASIVRAWNFVDEAGQPIPLGVDGLRNSVPLDLFRMLQRKWSEALKNPLPVTTSPESSKPSQRAASRRRKSSSS